MVETALRAICRTCCKDVVNALRFIGNLFNYHRENSSVGCWSQNDESIFVVLFEQNWRTMTRSLDIFLADSVTADVLNIPIIPIQTIHINHVYRNVLQSNTRRKGLLMERGEL
jgi:hypothetical protein